MRSLNNKIERERLRDSHFYNGLFFLFKFLLYVLPLCLFLSYHPVIKLGESETMYFELSMAEIWLVVFDAVAVAEMVRRKKLFVGLRQKRWWMWLLFPVWVTLSVVWSLNTTRGVLTAGMMWLVILAGYAMWGLKDELDARFREVWWKWFFGATLFVCGWCVVQCVLDLVGVGQEYSLMCDGCTYRMFGFPHPNGFAIEPQFMGNLLLAPTIVVAWLLLRGNCNSALRGRGSSRPSLRGSDPSSLDQGSPTGRRLETKSKLSACSAPTVVGRNLRKPLRTLLPVASWKRTATSSHSLCPCFLLLCLFVVATTLFLTFSRGAIYAFVVGMLFMSGFMVFGMRKQERGGLWKRMGLTWSVVVLAFVMALNLQGLMSEVGPTDDTYFDGVAKVVNHLSLGVIDLNGDDAVREVEKNENTEGELMDDRFEVVEKPVENFEENSGKEEAVFDGYVAESTDTRVRLFGAAVSIWSQNPKNVLLGVGLGGAGQVLYDNGLSPAPREIVQNEYASLLLETGLVGVSLFVLMMVLVVRLVWKDSMRAMILSLLVAYGISLVFFSGLPNALHVYLLPVVILAVYIPDVCF